MKQKKIFDAGVSSTTDLPLEINDSGGQYSSTPKSPYAVTESTSLTFTNKVVEPYGDRLRIADGDRRPGTAS